jgi:hypothetical protein
MCLSLRLPRCQNRMAGYSLKQWAGDYFVLKEILGEFFNSKRGYFSSRHPIRGEMEFETG